jgi:hypothetical protein
MVSNWLSLSVNLLWILTAVVMLVALIIIKKSLDAQSRGAVNVCEMSIHFSAFAIFAADCAYVAITGFMVK